MELVKKRKRDLALVLLMLLLLSVWLPGFMLEVYAEDTTEWVQITTREGLVAIGANADSLGKNYVLMNDIELSGDPWVSLGSLENPFTGTLDGNGYVIKNLNIEAITSDNQGLFSKTAGTVTNLGLEGASIAAGNNVGMIAGVNSGTIENSYALGGVSGLENVGGLVGINSGTINNSYVRGAVGGLDTVGGLAGLNEGAGTVSHSYAASSVTASTTNYYLQFNGNGYVEIPHREMYVGNKFTLEAWFQWNRVNTADVNFIMGKGFEQFEIHTGGGAGVNGLRFIPIWNEDGDSHIDIKNVLQTGWFHVAAVYDYDPVSHNATISFYVNGEAQDLWQGDNNRGKEITLSRPFNTLGYDKVEGAYVKTENPMNIGRRTDGWFYFNGKISDVRFWNTARTADEIANYKDRLLSGGEEGLVGYWRLNEASGETAVDSSMTRNNGTLIEDVTRVTSDVEVPKGGLIGSNNGGTVTNSYYDSTVSGQSDDTGKGVPKTTAAMKDQETFPDGETGWDFNTVWSLENDAVNDGYPYLKIFNRSTITYHGNGNTGGTAPVDNASYSEGESVTVSGKGDLEKGELSFAGWNTQADGGGTSYSPNASLMMGAGDVHLYAQWAGLVGSAGDTTFTKPGDAVVIDPGLTLEGFTDNFDSASVMVQNHEDGDTLTYTTVHGIAGAYDEATGILALTGNATPAQYQEALRSVRFSTTSDEPTDRTLVFSLGSGLYFSGTGHYYEYVTSSTSLTWAEAEAAARTRTLYGRQGYLATITSKAENDFIAEKTPSLGWIGARDINRNLADGSFVTVGLSEGDWRWVAGPEGTEDGGKGKKFYSGYAVEGGGGTPVEGIYANWAAGEPNNAGGEWVAHIYENGQWNDFPGAHRITGYVVEYGGMEGDTPVNLQSAKTVTIVPATYTVTFESNGGSEVAAMTGVVHGSAIEAPEAPTKTGFTFAGWHKEAGLENLWVFQPADDPDPVTGNTTLYAKWDASTGTAYKVEHYRQDVTGSGYTLFETDTLTGTTGDTVTATPKTYTGFTENTSRDDRVVSGPVAADGSLVLKLYYDRDTFTVTFDSDGGSAVATITEVRYEAGITAPAEPGKEGHIFRGWYKESETVNAWHFDTDKVMNDTTLYAKWLDAASIRLEASPDTVKGNVNFNQTFTLTVENDTVTGHVYGSDLTLGGSFSDLTLGNVDHDYEGGTPNVISITLTGPLTSSGIGTISLSSEKLQDSTSSLAAEISVTLPTLTYHGNGHTGGSVPAEAQGYPIGGTVTVPGNTGSLVKTGYTFAGWNTQANGSGTTYQAGSTLTMQSENVTLYAQWNVVSAPAPQPERDRDQDPPPAPAPEPEETATQAETTTTTTTSTTVEVNGITYNTGNETTQQREDGKVETTLEVNSETAITIMKEILANLANATPGTQPVPNRLEIPVNNPGTDIIKSRLENNLVQAMTEENFNLRINAGDVAYEIPSAELSKEKAEAIAGVPLDNFQVEITMERVPQVEIDAIVEATRQQGQEVIVPPMRFTITGTGTDPDGNPVTVDMNTHSRYSQRIMEIPEGMDPSKITTGIIFHADGSYSHVPTEVYQENGRWYARINSLTNSTYSVIWNPITVESVENHWAKDHVNDMASRLVITNPESFAPDAPITRADFAQYITKALGVYHTGSKVQPRFTDMAPGHSHTQALNAAVDYGIISGYPNGTFGPERSITREEAMTMFAKAMDITALESFASMALENYQDQDKISEWAKPFVQQSVDSGIFCGRSAETIDPKGIFTHAEAATAIRNLLTRARLINP